MLRRLTDWLVPGSRLSFWLHLLVLGLLSLGSINLRSWYEYRLGEFFLQQHMYVEARKHLERCLVTWPGSIPLKLHLARAERIAGSLDNAEEYLTGLRYSNQALPESYYIETLLLAVNRGYVEDVEPKLHDYLRNNHPESPAIYETLVMYYLNVKDSRRVHILLDLWQKHEPDNFLVYEFRGDCLAFQGQVDLAIMELLHAIQLNPHALEARLALCDLYFASAKIPELAPHVRFLQDYYEDNRSVRLVIARYHIELNHFEEADDQLAILRKQDPDNYEALVVQGTSYFRRGDYQHAVEFFRPAVNVKPGNFKVLYMLERALTALNDPELALFRGKVKLVKTRMDRIRELTDGLNIHKRQPTMDEKIERGELYLLVGETNAGLRDLGPILKQFPNNQRIHQILADYYTSTNDQATASQHLRKLENLKMQQSSAPP
jgi:tetratricopeptide (TPR) repeat protein